MVAFMRAMKKKTSNTYMVYICTKCKEKDHPGAIKQNGIPVQFL
jgi:hypothetical protein